MLSPVALALLILCLFIILFWDVARKFVAVLAILALTFALGMYYGRGRTPFADAPPDNHWSETRR